MKKIRSVLWILLLTSGLSLLLTGTYAQDSRVSRKERKELRKAELHDNFLVLDTLLGMKYFVLKADFLDNERGARVSVSPILNFIRIDSSNVVIQVGSVNGLGYNGVGGVTAQGNIDRWKLIRDHKNLSYKLNFSASTNIGFFDIHMTVSADNFARATVTGLWNDRIVFEGHLQNIYNSGIFKGQNTL